MLEKKMTSAPILALHGGEPVRKTPLPYGRQEITQGDIDEVVDTLKSPWLTTGPKVLEFENKFAKYTTSQYAVSVNSGTAALHAALFAIGLEKGDEVLLSPLTFVATANAILYLGGKPVFCDVDEETLLLDPMKLSAKISTKTKAILSVDYAGQPCDYQALLKISEQKSLWLVDDGCHALGASYQNKKIGSVADITAFSFHPVKHITTGEGGMITTDDPELSERARNFRNHGITSDFRVREKLGNWQYEMHFLGFNYRLNDIQCALGCSQLDRLETFITARKRLAQIYDKNLAERECLKPVKNLAGDGHAYHLYIVRLESSRWKTDRDTVFAALRAEGINVNVHYSPVHLHPYYRKQLRTQAGLCPIAEKASTQLLSLPLYPSMTESDQNDVLEAIEKVWLYYGK